MRLGHITSKFLSLIRRRAPASGFQCSVISQSPYILHTKDSMDFNWLGKLLAGRRAFFLVSFAATCENTRRVAATTLVYRNHIAAHPQHHFVFLCNTERELTLLNNLGIPAVFCNSNAFVDEKIFDVDANIEKQFDAIYDSQLLPVKRFELTASLGNLAIITYLHRSANRRYGSKVRQLLSNANWLNDPFDQQRSALLAECEVAATYNASRCGLCLSSVEGAMYSSIQYLLCGLPVVTTKSIGGRDVFFDEEYVVYVDPTPQSVQAGVERALALGVNADYIRSKTLLRMAIHRTTYTDLVQEIFDREGANRDFAKCWPEVYCNKMIAYHSKELLIASATADV
jgi:hypothetical protein